MLAQTATSVTGVDSNESSIRQASSTYKLENLKFIPGSRSRVPVTGEHCFDVILCFGGFEFLSDPVPVLVEVKRLLKPDGVLIVSARQDTAIRSILDGQFKHVQWMGQRIDANSSIWPLDVSSVSSTGNVKELVITPDVIREPQHFIAVASDIAAAVHAVPSILMDPENSLLKDKERVERELRENRDYLRITLQDTDAKRTEITESAMKLEKAVVWQKSQIELQTESSNQNRWLADQLQRTIESNNEALAWRRSQVSELEGIVARVVADVQQLHRSIESRDEALEWRRAQVLELEKVVDAMGARAQELQRSMASRDEALAWRKTQVEELEKAVEWSTGELENAKAQLENTKAQLDDIKVLFAQAMSRLAAVESSRGWKFILFARRCRDRVFLKR